MTEQPYTTQADYNQAVHNAKARGGAAADEYIGRIRDTHTAIPELITPAGLEVLATHDADVLAGKLRIAAVNYYEGDVETMTDAQYDQGIEQLRALITAHPSLNGQYDDLITKVAAGQSTGGDVEHPQMMGSLEKATDLDAVTDFLTKLSGPAVVEPKLDGLAIRAVYERGRLTLVATRGDGRTGENITDAVRRLKIKGLPETVIAPQTQDGNAATFEVRGEVFMADADYPRAQDIRATLGGKPFVNPRNAAAGILRKGDAAYASALTFAGYAATFASLSTVSWSHDTLMETIERSGITTARSLLADRVNVPTTDAEQVIADINYIGDNRATLGFPIDGVVIKATTVEDRIALGEGSRAPRWAIAYKFEADRATSILREVSWSVGKTGFIAPRAHLDPVFVGGAVVSYATLHNVGDIQRRGLQIGQEVIVLRAGDVIPRVEGPTGQVTGNETAIAFPEVCPQCGGPIDRAQARWRCEKGRACGIESNLRAAISRDALDIDGMGSQIIASLVESGRVNDLADIFTLTIDDLLAVDRLGRSNATKLLAEIEKARMAPLSRLITALGLAGTGRSMSRRIAAHFASMDAFRNASTEEVASIDGLGDKKAASIVAELVEIADLLDRLAAAGVSMQDEKPSADGGALPLAGMTVVISGSVPGLSRTEANEVVEANGGKSSSSVSKATSLLVSEPSTSSKYLKAQSLGVQIVEPAEFLAMIGR